MGIKYTTCLAHAVSRRPIEIRQNGFLGKATVTTSFGEEEDGRPRFSVQLFKSDGTRSKLCVLIFMSSDKQAYLRKSDLEELSSQGFLEPHDPIAAPSSDFGQLASMVP